MAALTKAQVRSMVQQLLDDPNAALWSATNLDLLISLIYDEMWSLLLNNSSMLLSQKDVLTSLITPGFIDLRLVADGGSLSQRFHRLQSIVRDNQTYRKADPRDVVLEGNTVIWAPAFQYVFYADQAWLFPLDTTTDVEIRYSFKPASFSSLTDTTAITWPDGHESALIFESAGRAMLKGEREDSSRLLAVAAAAKDEMIHTVRNRSHYMTIPWSPSTAEEFGGT